jgi:DNA-binding response OmpR family regulator
VPDLSGIEVLAGPDRSVAAVAGVFVITSHDSGPTSSKRSSPAPTTTSSSRCAVPELIARIEAAWRRHTGKANATGSIEVGSYRLDRGRSQAWLQGAADRAHAEEFDIAWHLFRHLGSMIARDDILRAVWGLNDSVQTRTLDVHMSRVRRKLALRPENGVRLQSIYSFGYRFDLAAE